MVEAKLRLCLCTARGQCRQSSRPCGANRTLSRHCRAKLKVPSVHESRSPWIGSAFSYAHAQLADDEHFELRMRDALAPAHTSRWPFQRARLQLAYGTWLRRQRRVAEARAPLRS